jgi:hypothetical protein
MKHLKPFNQVNEELLSDFADKVGQFLTDEERKVQGNEVKFTGNPTLKRIDMQKLFRTVKHPKMTAFVKKISFEFKRMSGDKFDIFDAYVTPYGMQVVGFHDRYKLEEGQFGDDLWLKVSYDSKNNKQITKELIDKIKNVYGKEFIQGFPIIQIGNKDGNDFILVNYLFVSSLVY